VFPPAAERVCCFGCNFFCGHHVTCSRTELVWLEKGCKRKLMAMKTVLRIGSEWFNWIIVANRKLSLGRNMDQQYKQEVKYGQNGLQRVLSVMAFWQTLHGNNDIFGCPTNRFFLHAGSYFLLWSIPQRAPSETWETKEKACLLPSLFVFCSLWWNDSFNDRIS